MNRCCFSFFAASIAVLATLCTLGASAADAGALDIALTAQDDQPPAPDLAGDWLLTLPAGFTHKVELKPLGKGRYAMTPKSLNMSGVYELKDGKLSIREPNDKRLTEWEWKLDGDDRLTLSGQPPVEKTGADYDGASLSRKAEDNAEPSALGAGLPTPPASLSRKAEDNAEPQGGSR